MTDPRAALAEHLMTVYPFDSETAHILIEDLAERGVLLVTEADVERACRIVWDGAFPPEGWAAAIFAALSGEVE